MDSTEIGRIEDEKGAVVVSSYKGKDGSDRIDVRFFVKTEKYDGPTKHGCSVSKDRKQELADLILKA